MKSQFMQRWNDPEFVSNTRSLLEQFARSRTLPPKADLRGIVVGMDGALPEMINGDFIGVKLDEVDASFSRFSCSFAGTQARDCLFLDANFDTCLFPKAQFVDCRLSRCKFSNPYLNDAIFARCDLVDAHLRGGNSKGYGGRRLLLDSCNLSRVVFSGLQFRATVFRNCTLTGTEFSKCLLVGVKFEGNAPEEEAFKDCMVQFVRMDGCAERDG